MDLISHSVLVVSAACFTLGAINLRLWLGNRARMDIAAIAGICLFGGAYSLFEVSWLHTTSLHDFGEIARWSQIASWGVVVSLTLFLRVHLDAGRNWLMWTVVGLRTFGVCINFAMPVNIQFREMTAIEQVTILGEKISYPVGVANPWHVVQAASLVLLVAFALDACIAVWRRGEHRKALIFGGGVTLLGLTSIGMAVAVIWLSLKFPPFASPALMFVIVGMAVEFDYDLRRSRRLAGELSHREVELTEALEELNLSASAGQVGIWAREIGNANLWVSEKMRELFGFDDSRPVTVDRYFEAMLPQDRERIQDVQRAAVESGHPYDAEYRLQLRNGDVRWMRSQGQVQTLANGRKLLRGASVDITRTKLAEADAHELSHKLIGAQEKERARLARELHDDLSQSLALLSIQLQSFTKRSNNGAVKKQVDDLTEQVQQLSSDVHRISHELHPSKLSQLGLEAAVRGFCRETGAAHGLKIGFKGGNIPRSLPDDLSLCIYRIAQEALQNVVKHSGASMVNVELRLVEAVVTLLISDNGCGFDPEMARSKDALGLISMNERVRAVDGRLTVESVPGSGTKIEAKVPLPSS